jgi:hypothetical protein
MARDPVERRGFSLARSPSRARPSHRAEEKPRVPRDELIAEIAEEGMEAEAPEIFVEVPETTAECEHFDPGLAGASAEALHAAATGAVRIDRGRQPSSRENLE